MTAALLTSELTNLISEAKRKNSELRTAAEKSLQELKGLPTSSEQQLAVAFIEPFLIACGTRNARFAGSGVTCLQRLIIARGLPKSRLQDALEAFNACTDLGLDIQLKILQALPSLLQNYADDLKGDLLSGALEVCTSLQSAKVQTVSGVAAATLQQLVTSVFEKVVNEDKHARDVQAQNEVPGDTGPIKLRPAAFDAYRVFRDLALAAEDRKTKFVQFASLSEESGLELIWSCINANPNLFIKHPELGSIIRSNILPFATRALSEKLSFPATLRSLRILDLVLSRYTSQLPAECEVALGLTTHTLDPDAAPLWKRAAAMEVLRNFFTDGNRVVEAYSLYDMAEGGKPVVQDLMSAFVRLSSEKPSIIGLGQQSTMPAGPVSAKEANPEQATVEAAGGVTGMISSALGVTEVNVAGISSKWSSPRTACLEQLDKTDPPPVPETYMYALVLECLTSLSDGLAKVTLPLTVQHAKSQARDGINGQPPAENPGSSRTSSQSFRKRSVPLNPLEHEDNAAAGRVRAVNGLVESCWPAVLATSSTFLNAALDDLYYRNLIKAYQRFTQVAGLLRLSTARDALMTTLGKSAVPPHVLNAATSEPPRTPVAESPRVFSNPKSLLAVENPLDRDRRGSVEPVRPILTTRNLLCLRAQLNLAIALGPTLDTAFAVVVDTLRQADTVLSVTTPQQMARQGLAPSQKGSESPNVVQAFTNEIAAVEAAASRLLESTADYPNDAFLNVLNTLCRVLHCRDPIATASPRPDQASAPPTPTMLSRTFSGLTGVSSLREMQMRDYKFVIPKLGSLAEINVARLVSDDPGESGWNVLVDELVPLACNDTNPIEARRATTGVLCKMAAEVIAEVMEDAEVTRSAIQRRTLAILLRLIDGIYSDDGDLSSADIDVQGRVVDALRAILERCGESLVAGWNRTIAIISSVFERSGSPPDRQDDEETHIDWPHVSMGLVSVQLGRAAFAATQLICSDFLSALSDAVIPSLVELLYRFSVQSDDLNISLTSITMTWNVSDFLLNSVGADALNEFAQQVKEADDIGDRVQGMVRTSGSAQWLLLLLRLQDIIKTGHKEVRKATFQTLCSIFKNNGEQLTPATWDLTLRSIILRIAFFDSSLYRTDDEKEGKPDDNSNAEDKGISTAIITGISEIIAQYVRLIECVKQLPSLWEAFLGRLEGYLDLEIRALDAAVYQALTRVLARIGTDSKIWAGLMYRTLHLWLKNNPATAQTKSKESNQASFIAYVDAGAELYRLTQQSMSTSQTRTFVENLYMCIRFSDGPRYGADVLTLSPLQTKLFELLKTIHPDTPQPLVVVAAKMVTLHHDTSGDKPLDNMKPTFVAIASDAIDWLQELVLTSITDVDLLENDVLVNVIQCLRRLIDKKYASQLEHKGTPLWQKATSSAVKLAKPVLEQCVRPEADKSTTAAIWMEYVRVVSGVMKANGIDDVNDDDKIDEDQLKDIESFRALRATLIPRLGGGDLPDATRTAYARSLFDASIVHPTEPKEVPDDEHSPLHDIGKIRRGRVRRVPYSPREQMCYECFSELMVLSSKSDSSAESKRLAQAAAPFLILRLAIPIRAYIADQPLRGRRPQPLWELEELLFCFDAIKKLDLEPDALRDDPVAAGRTGEKAHLHYLYPLLAEAIGTAGDKWSGADEVLTPLQAVLEAISPVP
ncbi:Endocytosis and vacuole integrity protein [Vermiconidia calcicola]|uniref:Endocytosis and vacuole integrity protein n=1 Tax=Vermiconidia calcicola TaxID=1690605 RepID=A0ACC3MBF2_9PEZI|nr:Endocytosis and vacuole integrity protein [Vermiconidia calcicola]